MSKPLSLGTFRPIYLWGGPGTSRMLRLKFMGASVDEKMHNFAHSVEGAERVAAMGFNWAFLAYNWGFPPEIEAQDWESFRSAMNHFQKAGIKVLGYIQSSNCVDTGSYAAKDWYAVDVDGRRIPIYSNRYFTSLTHAGWLAEVRERVRSLAEMGVDGIYFDNPWQGGIGIDLAEMPFGFIGSYDVHSRQAYAAAFNGAQIPVVVNVGNPETQQYLRWRAQIAVNAVRDWAQAARDINPDLVITANNFDAIVHNSYVEMGMDLEGMADIQDVMVLENFSLPRIQDDGAVVANAITIGAAKARVEKPVATLPYINGIGFDHMWQPRQFKRMIAEGIAMNGPIIIRGTTFIHRGEYTLLLHRRYEKQQQALTQMNTWLQTHADWLDSVQPGGKLAVYHPFEVVRWNWNRTIPYFFAACQVLLQHGYSLRIVGDDDDWTGVETLIVPPGEVEGLADRLSAFVSEGGRIIRVGPASRQANERLVWQKWRPIPHRIPPWRWLRRRINQGAGFSWRLYHRWRIVRWFAERFDFHLRTTQSPLFLNVPADQSFELTRSLGNTIYPRIKSEYPVLLTEWQEPDGSRQWRLVNYADHSQKVTLEFNELVKAQVFAIGEDTPPQQIVGSALMLTIDTGKILRVQKKDS